MTFDSWPGLLLCESPKDESQQWWLWNQYNDLTNAVLAVGFSASLAAMASGESLNLHGLYGGSWSGFKQMTKASSWAWNAARKHVGLTVLNFTINKVVLECPLCTSTVNQKCGRFSVLWSLGTPASWYATEFGDSLLSVPDHFIPQYLKVLSRGYYYPVSPITAGEFVISDTCWMYNALCVIWPGSGANDDTDFEVSAQGIQMIVVYLYISVVSIPRLIINKVDAAEDDTGASIYVIVSDCGTGGAK